MIIEYWLTKLIIYKSSKYYVMLWKNGYSEISFLMAASENKKM